jgi:hypothetical protein
LEFRVKEPETPNPKPEIRNFTACSFPQLY